MKKILIVVLTLTMCVSLFACSSEANDRRSIEKVIDVLNDVCYFYEYNEKNLLKVAPEDFWQSWADNYTDGDLEELFDDMEREGETERSGDDELPKEVEYEITYFTQLSEDECERVEEGLEKRDDINYENISNAYSFKMKFIITDSDGENYEEGPYNFVAVKMEDEWYIADYTEKRIRWTVDGFI